MNTIYSRNKIGNAYFELSLPLLYALTHSSHNVVRTYISHFGNNDLDVIGGIGLLDHQTYHALDVSALVIGSNWYIARKMTKPTICFTQK
ncbi:hypothetical protein CEXT_487551 [Caerostris extrusa]|uniref:Uncharacterized protein n=1 Tax=Caerostris extrusa TaxID=172846 RepID=A0AAV4TGX8_CAEEX|nr:hypothetical protein CEXT_487551 [Caerostris extrusa]